MIFRKNFTKNLISFFLTGMILISPICKLSVHAEPIDYNQLEEERKLLPVQSDNYPNWPAGPRVGAEAAILIDADTGIILYEKNIHEKLYPASITKILTTLIGSESCSMDEMVTFSKEAVFSITSDSSSAGLDVGESISVEQCMYAILVGSANEAANGLAEHIAGSMDKFAELMNEKSEELGCVDSHWVTTNGLHDDNHYTSAYDMAQIGRAFFNNELLCKMASTPNYHIPQSSTQPDDDLYLHSKNQLYKTGSCEYEFLIGSKTGYTGLARQTLVSCAKKDGLKLICVVLKEESPHQFTDTVDLFNFGFENFKKVNLTNNQSDFSITKPEFFVGNANVFGEDKEFFTFDTNSYVTIPKEISVSDLNTSLVINDSSDTDSFAKIIYDYNGIYVGSSNINLSYDTTHLSDNNDKDKLISINAPSESKVYYFDTLHIIIIISIIHILIVSSFFIKSLIDNYAFSKKKRRKKKKPHTEVVLKRIQ